MKKTVRSIVKKKLEEKPKTRNSDKLLMFSIWFDQGIVHKYNDDWKIGFNDFMKVAISPESIKRARQQVQNDPKNGHLEPTDPEIRKARNFKEKNFEEMVINALY